MKKILFTFITIHQNSDEKAEIFSRQLMRELGLKSKPLINKYHKFKNSYKIEFAKELSKKINHKLEVIEMASKIGEPWNIYFDNDDGSIELIFNRTKHTHFTNIEFCDIRWAQILIHK